MSGKNRQALLTLFLVDFLTASDAKPAAARDRHLVFQFQFLTSKHMNRLILCHNSPHERLRVCIGVIFSLHLISRPTRRSIGEAI